MIMNALRCDSCDTGTLSVTFPTVLDAAPGLFEKSGKRCSKMISRFLSQAERLADLEAQLSEKKQENSELKLKLKEVLDSREQGAMINKVLCWAPLAPDMRLFPENDRTLVAAERYMEGAIAIWQKRLQALVAFEEKSSEAVQLLPACSTSEASEEWYSGKTYMSTQTGRV